MITLLIALGLLCNPPMDFDVEPRADVITQSQISARLAPKAEYKLTTM